MGRIGFVGGSYTARSTAVAAEECINWFAETRESQGAVSAGKAYGGQMAQGSLSYSGTPGMIAFTTFPAVPRASCWTGSRMFAVEGSNLVEVYEDGAQTVRGAVSSDGAVASIACSNIELLVVSNGRAFCYAMATNILTEVTAQLAGIPIRAEVSDGYFIVFFKNSNKFQVSSILDGNTWPGLQVNAVSVFAENITAIIVNHRELWVFGSAHAQPYQNTGSDEIFDVIPGALIEKGNAAAFAPCRLDNSVFWIDEDERGGRSAWRSQGYTPGRISTHAVEGDLASYPGDAIAGMTSFSYQDQGHLFWVLYIPGSEWSWCYDVAEGLWHKRAFWNDGAWEAHHSWNHVYAFGKHLVGDWSSGNMYEMTLSAVDDAGAAIRRMRRTPTVSDEMQWISHVELCVDFDTGQGPQPPLLDGDGNPRAPQAMLRWSDDRGKTWSNEHIADCGQAGEYRTRVIWRRLGRSRYRVYELTVSDPIQWTIVDAYLRTA